MSYIVFWLEDTSGIGEEAYFEPRCEDCGNNMTVAMAVVEKRRKRWDCKHVTLSSENPDQIGKMGVQSVENGKLPDGSDYTWKMRR